MRRDRLLIYLVLFIFSGQCHAKNILYSSVSPEFPAGLHFKYLQHIAQKMDMELDIVPMPFARRVVALQSGLIDLMVGMQREDSRDDDIIYIYPAYEKLRHSFFVLASNQDKLRSFEDLLQLNIGVTIHAKYYQHFQQQPGLSLAAVSTLKQKIELLRKERIDTFIHYQESTEPLLRRMHLDSEIVIAPYQPTEYNEYYITISKNSRLLPYREKLEKLVKTAVENGDLRQIREQHYQL